MNTETREEAGTKGAGPLAIRTINPPNLSNLEGCIADTVQAWRDGDAGPADPTEFSRLRGRLEAVRDRFPPLYRDAFVKPYIATLDSLGEARFVRILVLDPNREGMAGLMLDMAQAILQQGESFAPVATDAFQEVVSDLYDGFLSAEDRRGVNPPEEGTIPPLVKWGNPSFGPYTFPTDATASFGAKAALVSLPPSHSRRGLLGWATLGHETAGHDILHADHGLREELIGAVLREVGTIDPVLAEYWAERIDETASDVLGILNMGPAAGIGLIGYFRGIDRAFGGPGKLRNEGSFEDPHPADILRGYLAAETVRLLKFTGKTKWEAAIRSETEKDLEGIVIDGVLITKERAVASAALVARVIVTTKAASLEQHALGDIQNWRDTDERKVLRVRKALRSALSLAPKDLTDIYAAHVVAAAVVEALSGETEVTQVFSRMLTLLKAMHDANPSWGPLFVRSPGNLARHATYLPSIAFATDDEDGASDGTQPSAKATRPSRRPS
jgi:hypothetical protein